MERLFFNRFYKPQPEVSITELMSLRQLPNEQVAEFLEQFKGLRSRCKVQLLEPECVMAVVNNMHTELRERLVTIEYSDLTQLK